MEYKKYDVITLGDNTKLIVLETLEYKGNIYLYVDVVNDEETDTLDRYHIIKVCKNNSVQKETDLNVLTNILPLFSKNIRLNNE